MKVSDGTRTHDRLDHNQELYQLSYAHRGELNLPLPRPQDRTSATIGAMEMGAGVGVGEGLINSIS